MSVRTPGAWRTRHDSHAISRSKARSTPRATVRAGTRCSAPRPPALCSAVAGDPGRGGVVAAVQLGHLAMGRHPGWKEFPREITIGRGIPASGLALLGSPFLLAWGVAGLRVRLLVRLRMRWPEGVVALS